jgi:PAS domain S-box-containing protein
VSVSGIVDEMLDHAPCGYVSFGDDGVVVAANATLLERVGYAWGELVGRQFETILTVGSRIFHQTHFFPLIKLHGGAQEIFLLLRTRGGSDVGVLCNATRRERGGLAVTDCIFLEVHERRKYEDALLQAKRTAEEANQTLEEQAVELELQQHQLQEQTTELEMQAEALEQLNQELTERTVELERQRAAAADANRAKSSFLAVMSHELRTPLNAIGGYVQLLQMEVHGPVSEAQQEALERIDRSQRHLLRLINDVLNLSRIEAGRVDYDVEPAALDALVTSVLPMVEPQIAAKELRLEVRVASTLVAMADREKVKQILLNLLTNAVKFTMPGGRIRLEGAANAPRSGTVSVRVSDSGVGIPADMGDRIFEPFVQVDASRTRATEGTGLGLAISRDLARGMGGELTMESDVGVGSTFTLTLRAAPSMGARSVEVSTVDGHSARSTLSD